MFLQCLAYISIKMSSYGGSQMRKNLLFLGTTLVSVALIVIVFGSYVIVAQTVVSGDWTADSTDTKDGKIHLSINRSADKGHRNQFGSDFAIEDLQGLSQSQLAGGKVNFRLVREAGLSILRARSLTAKAREHSNLPPTRTMYRL